VSLVLDLRAAEAAVPPERPELRAQLDRIADGVAGALEELRELSRGIHPAILSEGGLGPALKALARPGRAGGGRTRAAARAGRGGGLLRGLRGAGQRG
jgi:signal transduction histidine kinase